ncbi:S53 family peptidase [Solimicrobium silvestre]|uniref:Pro-kumamolisin, activation domain n=1 Tax=Solimicrobium silvestre TaxID=2099400 RepID=A0A2S9GT69_9BURK|nr:S53 family peptidase [Solimicrobium silvestre]PRC90905.1 Pro-kumamolisin, activation domain [Solimicrobium silvestre]
MKLRTKPLAALVSGLFVGALWSSSGAFAATVSATAQDLGATAPTQTQTVSIVLQLRNVDHLTDFIAATVNPNSNRYHQFLSVDDFARHYAPTDADIGRVTAALNQLGIQVNEVYKNHMIIRATGTTAQLNQFFNTEVHNYKENTTLYSKPNRKVSIPDSVADVVLTVTGLDTKPKAHPMSRNLAKATGGALSINANSVKLLNGVTTANAPGLFTVADVASLYNINPLYEHHILGQGRAVGIATLATFTPSDAYTYWQSVGLKVSPNKIVQVHVDGGAGTNGSGETTLDVEQSGGLAPASKVFVYDAPNTDAGFIDVFFKAASDNIVDTLSTSWGEPEIAQDSDVLAGQHQAFLELAAQGITMFAAAGDEGAYDINDNQGPYAYPGCSQLLSVDSPASDPFVVAAGGLTLAGVQTFPNASITVPKDRPWAWDYLQNYIETYYGSAVYYADVFPVGGGGGVSVNYPLPRYQKYISGTQVSAANQSLICQSPTGPQDLVDLPAGYVGRNVPDLSLNADPDTGYALYVGGAWQYGWGGTSFVAPQLNGITALLSQFSGTRLGHLNPQLYALLQQYGYSHNSPFRAITSGDNEYWQATHSYNPASGIGALDVTNLARTLSGWGY